MSNEWIVGAIIVMAFKPEIMASFYRVKKRIMAVFYRAKKQLMPSLFRLKKLITKKITCARQGCNWSKKEGYDAQTKG